MSAREMNHLLLTVGGLGRSPIAPGSLGALPAIPVAALLQDSHWSSWFALCLFLSVSGVIQVTFYLNEKSQRIRHPNSKNSHDPQEVVLDEFIGCLIALAFVPWSWPWVLAAYLLFRIFDILKPGPIRWVDRNLTGGMGVIGDDVMAGLAAGLLLLGATGFWQG